MYFFSQTPVYNIFYLGSNKLGFYVKRHCINVYRIHVHTKNDQIYHM